mmetsp:Transcript_14079/g.52848  ORF Transcript_14079/g.52848 Transcript_14079/m.52848 type:complete len:234 (-) Transcript_14079:330-1031(-)
MHTGLFFHDPESMARSTTNIVTPTVATTTRKMKRILLMLPAFSALTDRRMFTCLVRNSNPRSHVATQASRSAQPSTVLCHGLQQPFRKFTEIHSRALGFQMSAELAPSTVSSSRSHFGTWSSPDEASPMAMGPRRPRLSRSPESRSNSATNVTNAARAAIPEMINMTFRIRFIDLKVSKFLTMLEVRNSTVSATPTTTFMTSRSQSRAARTFQKCAFCFLQNSRVRSIASRKA